MRKNYKCASYGLRESCWDTTNREYSYQELRKYFSMTGGDWELCIAEFRSFRPGYRYLVSDGKFYGYGFIIDSEVKIHEQDYRKMYEAG